MIVRFLPLLLSVVFAAVIAILVMTPLVWNLMGKPDETYPELVFLAFGAPPAFILIVASTVIAIRGSPRLGGALRPALRPLRLCMGFTGLFAAFLNTPFGNVIPEGTGQMVVDFTFYIAWPVLAVWVIAASVWGWTRPAAGTRA